MSSVETEDLLRYPSWSWSDEEKRLATERRVELQAEMYDVVDRAESQDRDLTDDERVRYDELKSEFDRLA